MQRHVLVPSRSMRTPIAVSLFRYGVLLVLSVVFLFPLAWMFISSFRPGADVQATPLDIDFSTLSLQNYTSLLNAVPLGIGFKNTLIILATKGSLALFFCPLAGFAFAKYQFRGKSVLFALVLATLMLPPIVFLIPLLLEMNTLGWVDSYQALIFPGSIGAFYIFWMRQQMGDIPNELLDAGRIDGCSPFGLFIRVALPIVRPALAALAVLVFLDIYNDFVWPVVVTNTSEMQTLQVMLSALYTQINSVQVGTTGVAAWGEVLAASSLATLPVLVLFVALQRQFIRGVLSGSLRG